MYGKKQKSGKKNPEAIETILGEGAVFEGNISCEGSMKVEGTLKGNVKADHTLVVGPKGSGHRGHKRRRGHNIRGSKREDRRRVA